MSQLRRGFFMIPALKVKLRLTTHIDALSGNVGCTCTRYVVDLPQNCLDSNERERDRDTERERERESCHSSDVACSSFKYVQLSIMLPKCFRFHILRWQVECGKGEEGMGKGRG